MLTGVPLQAWMGAIVIDPRACAPIETIGNDIGIAIAVTLGVLKVDMEAIGDPAVSRSKAAVSTCPLAVGVVRETATHGADVIPSAVVLGIGCNGPFS
ncbi:hypothetical protein BP5796_11571 [Coleophoma crateriformis]|uniref:Uncharacterized protein n=1 Tax=Coleophoma crateriformis TaxID=565419 RepID=A0A3D8QIS6_9HELO|nr:hypothetical protein BP5796_11571 [Coleophoma crateriformis]